MRLTILGSGDAFSSGGRFPSCYLVETTAMDFLLECGPAVLTTLKKAGLSSNAFSHVFISHLHGDHMAGLPFLLLDAIFPARRTAPLTLIGPPGLEGRFRQLCEVLYPRSLDIARQFDLAFIELKEGEPRDISGVTVTAFEVDHYSGSPSYALRFEQGGKILSFSGDSGWTDNLLRAGAGADVYLIECYQYALKLPMHLDYVTIADHFNAIGAKKLLLTHMSDAMLAERDKVNLSRCLLAEDGMIVDI